MNTIKRLKRRHIRSGRRRYVATLLALVTLMTATGVSTVSAQTAKDHFHTAAREYIGDQLAEATEAVDSGLALAPSDAELLALKELIEKANEEKQKQQEQQNQEDQQGQQDSEEEEQQGEQDQQQDSGEESDEQEQQQQEQDQEQQGDEQSDEQEQGGQQETESEGEGQGESEAEIDPNQLSREEAERILQALENEEGQLLRQVQKMKVRARRVEKDW